MYQDVYQVYELINRWNPQGPPDVEAVRRLCLEDQPGVAQRTFLYGTTLLHKCITNYSAAYDERTLDLIDVLIQAYPEAVTHADDEGNLPLHLAIQSMPMYRQQVALLASTSLLQDGSSGIIDIESNNSNNSNNKMLCLVQRLIEQAPETILEPTHTGALPLHLACQYCFDYCRRRRHRHRTYRPHDGHDSQNDDDNIEDTDDDADADEYTKDSFETEPLYHIRSEMSIVQYLLESYPESITYRDHYDKFPLDYALEATAIEDIQEDDQSQKRRYRFYQRQHQDTNKTTAGTTSDYDRCNNSYFYYYSKVPIIKYLLKFNSVILTLFRNDNKEIKEGKKSIHKEDHGEGKIHLAQNQSVATLPIHRLVNQAASMLTGARNSTSDYLSIQSMEMIQFLEIVVNANPGVLQYPDAQGYTPLCRACESDLHLSIIYHMVRTWPDQVRVGATNAFHTTTTTTTGDDGSSIVTADVHVEILPSALATSGMTLQKVQRWIEAISMNSSTTNLLMQQDSQGRVPLHYAVLNTKKSSLPSSSSSSSIRKIVEYLTTQCPDSICAQDNAGRTPLHYAAAAANVKVIDYISIEFPEQLLVADKDGCLPWHYAECARYDGLYEPTLEQLHLHSLQHDNFIELDYDTIPSEIRWDVIHVVPEQQEWSYKG